MEELGEFPKSASYGQKNHVIYREQGLKRLVQKRGREGSSWNPFHCNQAKPQEQMKQCRPSDKFRVFPQDSVSHNSSWKLHFPDGRMETSHTLQAGKSAATWVPTFAQRLLENLAKGGSLQCLLVAAPRGERRAGTDGKGPGGGGAPQTSFFKDPFLVSPAGFSHLTSSPPPLELIYRLSNLQRVAK